MFWSLIFKMYSRWKTSHGGLPVSLQKKTVEDSWTSFTQNRKSAGGVASYEETMGEGRTRRLTHIQCKGYLGS